MCGSRRQSRKTRRGNGGKASASGRNPAGGQAAGAGALASHEDAVEEQGPAGGGAAGGGADAIVGGAGAGSGSGGNGNGAESGALTDTKNKYIVELSRNARTNWYAQVIFLAFCWITLLGVEDKDFFSYDASTKLPVIDINIPTTSFFLFAPILAFVFYLQLHLFLLRLWEQIGQLRAGEDTAEIHPSLICEAAILALPDGGRRGYGPFRRWGLVAAIGGLVWLGGPLTLGFFWWRSMPKHDIWLTGFLGAALLASCVIGWACGSIALRCLRRGGTRSNGRRRAITGLSWGAAAVVIFSLVAVVSAGRTGVFDYEAMVAQVKKPEAGVKQERKKKNEKRGILTRLLVIAPAQMQGAEIAQRPEGWQPHAIAKAEFQAEYLRRIQAIYQIEGRFSDNWKNEFEREWQERRKEAIGRINRPGFGQPSVTERFWRHYFEEIDVEELLLDESLRAKVDFRYANLSGAFLVGISLNHARIGEANLLGANLESAFFLMSNLTNATLTGTDLTNANLIGATLTGARFERADLTNADLWFANLVGARFELANLSGASLWSVDLSGANLWHVDLSGGYLWEAILSGAELSGAMLKGADLEDAVLDGADIRRANLSDAMNLTQDQLDGCIGDEETILPDGLYVWSCWDDFPELPDGVAKPERWDWDWYRRLVLCEYVHGPGEKPRRTGISQSEWERRQVEAAEEEE